jgi:hypothetical protein
VAPPIADDRLKRAIESIRKGEYTAQKLQANFTLTLAQQSDLDKALVQMAGGSMEEVNA